MHINTKSLVENIISQSLGLDKYKTIIKNVKLLNVSIDKEFQKTFNHFYKVRRDKQWLETYYEFFEENKNKSDLNFECIITHLYQKTGQIEASFSSKLLATVNPDMPIWDQYVLRNLDLKLKGKTQDERLLNAIKLYSQLIEWYKKYLTTDNAKESIVLIKSLGSKFQFLTDTKIIDYLICGMRDA